MENQNPHPVQRPEMAFHNNSLDIDSIAITFTSRNKAEALRNCG
jgi:hypothetical protein